MESIPTGSWKKRAGIDIFSNRTDYGTLIPFLRHLGKAQQAKYQKLIADAGYETLEN